MLIITSTKKVMFLGLSIYMIINNNNIYNIIYKCIYK